MAEALSDVETAAAAARDRRRRGVLIRRTIFYAAVGWYFLFRIAQPVRLECARVENRRVNCVMLREWAGIIPADRELFTDVRRARLDEQLRWEGNIRLTNYFFSLDTGSLMRSRPGVEWMNRQNGAELETVTTDLNAWLSGPSSTDYRHTLRIDFINGMLVMFAGIAVIALVERAIKRHDAKHPLQLA